MQVPDVTRLFKTLGDPTRLRLLSLLAETELSVMDLSDVTQLAQSRVSNHLKLLREEDLIQERREGPWRHYRLDADRLPAEVRPLWEAIRETWTGDTQFLADRARLEEVLGRRHARNGRFFESIAGQWDAIRSGLFGDAIGREVLRLFVPANITVADIGSGTGYVIELFGDRPERLIAIDNSEAMLAVARQKVEAMGLDNVDFRLGDAHEPPLEAGEADLVTLVMVLHHLDAPGAAVGAAARAVGPGGRLLIADLALHQETWLRETMQHRWLGFTREEVEGWLRAGGLAPAGWVVLPGRVWTAPDGRNVILPNGFVALGERPESGANT